MKLKKWYYIIVGTLIAVSVFVMAGIYIYFSLLQGERIEWWFIGVLGMMLIMAACMFGFMLNSTISVKIEDETAAFEQLNGKREVLKLNEINLVEIKSNMTIFHTTNGKKIYSYKGVSKIKVDYHGRMYEDIKGWEFPHAVVKR